jgi:VWFA-related protein
MKAVASSLVLLALCSPAAVLAQSAAQDAAQPGTGAPDAAGSQATVTIRRTAQLVALDVVVTDKHGVPIHGLTSQDFHVFEEGAEQKISSYEEHRGAVGSASVVTTAIDPTTFTNQRINAESSPLCVILIDSLNTAVNYQSFAHYQLLKLARSLPAGSRVAVFQLGSKLSMLQGFTEDTAALIATLNSKQAGPQQGPFFDDADLGLALAAPDMAAGMGGGGQGGHTLAINDLNADILKSDLTVSMTLRALRTLGVYLSSLPGRKNLVWLSGSFPVDILPTLGGSGGLAEGDTRAYDAEIRDLALLLQSGNVSVYPVDVRGIVPGDMFSAARTGAGSPSAAVTSQAQSITGLALSNGQMQNTMQVMAALTGGRAYFNTNDISGSIAEAFNDGSNYYSLSYVPRWTEWDGKFRKIEVKLDQKDVRLYYRRGYYAEDPDKRKHSLPGPDPSMGVAMMHGTPETSQISFRLHLTPDSGVRTMEISAPILQKRDKVKAAVIKGPAQHYAVTYIVKPSDIAFLPAGSDRMHSDLAFSAIAYNAEGKILNSSIGVFNLPISAKTYDAVMHDALHISTGLDLPVGRVYLRLGVHDMSTGKIGTLEAALDVGAEPQRRGAH